MAIVRAVVVTYKTEWSKSETINSLLAMPCLSTSIELVLWDNSPVSHIDQDIVCRLSRTFAAVSTVHASHNEGLAKVYNTVARKPGFDIFVIFDQDTVFDAGYFAALEVAAAQPASVLLPIVRSGERIVSPGSYKLVKGRHWTKPRTGLLPSKGVVAISSGLAVRREYIERFPGAFDERLNLYGIDTAFMLAYARREPSVYVMDYVLKHHTMLWSNPPKATMLFRFKNLRRARLIMHRGDWALYPLALAYGGWSSLRMAARYRDLAFLRK